MPIKVPQIKGKSEFRNELVCFIDPKQIDIDRTMTNLFVLLRYNGGKPRLRIRRASDKLDIDKLVNAFQQTERDGKGVIGAIEHPDAVRWWLRSNLSDLVSRGSESESFATLRPIHLQSFTFRNARHTRDYFTSEQVYSFLSEDKAVRDELRQFLDEGWNGSSITSNQSLDVDSLGILRLIEDNTTNAQEDSQNVFARVKPLLATDAKNYCDDVHRLLQYRHTVPRHVLIDYIKTLTAFHLSLYTIKLVKYLPQMVREGSADIDTALSIVVDLTDNPGSGAARLANADAQGVYDSILEYIRANFALMLSLRNLDLSTTNSAHLEAALAALIQPDDNFMADTRSALRGIREHEDNKEELETIQDIISYEANDIQRYLALVVKARGPFYHKYLVQLLDTLMLKNNESGMLIGGRTRNSKRRFVLGTKLLEMLVQLSVLKTDGQTYRTEPVSMEDFLTWLNSRYGLVVNGIDTPRFQDADLETHQAFRDNVQAFRNKLRQIGFYTVLSDAYILQKIRPRYTLNP